MCPQTCSNTLELPNYYRSMCEVARAAHAEPPGYEDCLELLRFKLTQAVLDTSGYGLDTMASDRAPGHASAAYTGGGAMSMIPRVSPVTSAAVDSDSDDDPMPAPPPKAQPAPRQSGAVVLLTSFDSAAKDSAGEEKSSQDIIRSARQAGSAGGSSNSMTGTGGGGGSVGYVSYTVHSRAGMHGGTPTPTTVTSASLSASSLRSGSPGGAHGPTPYSTFVEVPRRSVSNAPESKAAEERKAPAPAAKKPVAPAVPAAPVSIPVPDKVDGFDWDEVEELNLL